MIGVKHRVHFSLYQCNPLVDSGTDPQLYGLVTMLLTLSSPAVIRRDNFRNCHSKRRRQNIFRDFFNRSAPKGNPSGPTAVIFFVNTVADEGSGVNNFFCHLLPPAIVWNCPAVQAVPLSSFKFLERISGSIPLSAGFVFGSGSSLIGALKSVQHHSAAGMSAVAFSGCWTKRLRFGAASAVKTLFRRQFLPPVVLQLPVEGRLSTRASLLISGFAAFRRIFPDLNLLRF